MKCECGNDAEYILLDYDSAKPICQTCLDELCYVEGEIHLDSYHLELGLERFIERVNEILKYHERKYAALLREYSKLKKEAEKNE